MCGCPLSSSNPAEPALIKAATRSGAAPARGITISIAHTFHSFACKILICGHFIIAIEQVWRFGASFECSLHYPAFVEVLASCALR